MKQKHSPLPWRVFVDDSGGQFTGWPSIQAPEEADHAVVHRAGFKQEFWGDLSQAQTHDNADFIVLACNNHYKLVDALKTAADRVELFLSTHGDFANYATLADLNDWRDILAEAEA